MQERIIFQNDDGGISIVIPAVECGLTVAEIAAKDVPAGRPYKIIMASDIPADRTFRDAWEADFTTYDGIGGAQ